MIVTAGLAYLATQIVTDYTYMGIGEGIDAVALGDTTLGGEIIAYRAICDTHSATEAVATFENEFTVLAAGIALTEAGLFTAATAGNMFGRQVFSALNLNENDKIKITWTITFANA